MAAKLSGDDDAPIVDINITPLVDIVLVVLIIFMVSSSYINDPSIKVSLPEAATGDETDASSLGLTLTADGLLYLNGEPTTEPDLRAFIKQEKTTASDVTCLIAADAEVEHARVVWLIDLVKQEGVAKFAINIDPSTVKTGSVPAASRPADGGEAPTGNAPPATEGAEG